MKRGITMAIQVIFVILVLLVVAMIAIRMFMQGTQQLSQLSTVSLDKAKQECKNYCDQGDILDYCKYYFSADLDGDGQISMAVPSGTALQLQVCEDEIPCYIVKPCVSSSMGGISVIPIVCAKYLCEYYHDTAGLDWEYSTKKVFGYVNSISQNGISIDSEGDLKLGRRCGGVPEWYRLTVIDKLYGPILNGLKSWNSNVNILTNNGIIYVKNTTAGATYLVVNGVKLSQGSNGVPLCEVPKYFDYSQLVS